MDHHRSFEDVAPAPTINQPPTFIRAASSQATAVTVIIIATGIFIGAQSASRRVIRYRRCTNRVMSGGYSHRTSRPPSSYGDYNESRIGAAGTCRRSASGFVAVARCSCWNGSLLSCAIMTGFVSMLSNPSGAAARRLEGSRIPAVVVRARLFEPNDTVHGHRNRATPRQAGPAAKRLPGGASPTGSRDGEIRLRRLGGDPSLLEGSGRGRDGRGAGAAIGRLRALPAVRSLILKRRLPGLNITLARYAADVGPAQSAAEQLEAERAYENHRALGLVGVKGYRGLAADIRPLPGPPPRTISADVSTVSSAAIAELVRARC